MKSLQTLEVLVLEDDFYLAEDVRQALVEAGATIMGPFSDAAQAIAAVDLRKPSCALVDINLGGGPDFVTARALIARGVPVVFVTGYDCGVIPDEFKAVPCVLKPAEPRHILNALQSLGLA